MTRLLTIVCHGLEVVKQTFHFLLCLPWYATLVQSTNSHVLFSERDQQKMLYFGISDWSVSITVIIITQ